MKYIRTKDNVWQYDRNKNVVRPSEDGKSIVYWLHFDEKEILKSADTIEELCDEFVITCSENYEYKEFYPCLGTYTTIKEHKNSNEHTIYGAIWTDKGLIYVAKMNEKGDLELL